jgi:hypothetical protein
VPEKVLVLIKLTTTLTNYQYSKSIVFIWGSAIIKIGLTSFLVSLLKSERINFDAAHAVREMDKDLMLS